MSSNLGIEVRHLCKSFRKRKGVLRRRETETQALKDISFEVALGETYGLLGPNGSGKSTLIRVLSTLLVPDGGDLRLLGHRVPGEEGEVRRKIGRVSVDAAFYKKLSPRENLLFSAYLYGLEPREAERRALSILERLGLEGERFTDPLEEMSRGTQQKVAITRALLVNPPLLLLDEPTTGLDPKSRRDVQTFLEDLRREEGTTILLTSHDMAETERLCARVGFLARGRLIAEGTPRELKRRAGADSLDDAFIALAGESLEETEKNEQREVRAKNLNEPADEKAEVG
ncbi:MAG TPA: ABC transporter ATP-binding protein [Pyrinomonadaceae bacterium]|nr:ABC transporter ATP-binding protein [Pyrinomonadaceae bacterium]